MGGWLDRLMDVHGPRTWLLGTQPQSPVYEGTKKILEIHIPRIGIGFECPYCNDQSLYPYIHGEGAGITSKADEGY